MRFRYATRIVVIPPGTNLLGLLEIFAFVGVLFVPSLLPGDLAVSVSAVLFPVVLGAIAVQDVWWRLTDPDPMGWMRLISPFTGGCFLFLPLWILFPCFGVYIVAMR